MIGRTLGRYRITEKIGQGGIASVWKAHDALLGRTVALKILNDAFTNSFKARRRFLRDAQMAALLDHPGVVGVYDAGEAEGMSYIALAFIDGATLSDLAARRLMPIEEAVRIVSAAAEALGFAHEHGVIHRDVTGRNIMVARDGRVFVLDFGLALAVGTSRLTSSETAIGTVAYMAPEAVRGEDLDARADLYGLGVVLYEALTGAYPFSGERPEAMLFAILNQPPHPPRERRPEIPVALERIILKTIARERKDRYQSAAALLAELRALDPTETSSGAPPTAPQRNPVAPEQGTPEQDAPERGASGADREIHAPRPDPLYLAVLHFEVSDAPPDPENAASALASRLASTLSAALAGAAGVHVIPPPEPPLPPEARDTRSIARLLGANALLRGIVARRGTQLRVTWAMVNALRGVQFGGDVLDGSIVQPFDLEDQVVASVRRALGIEGATARDKPGSRPRDPAAEDRFVQAQRYLQRYDQEASVDGAIALLEQLAATEGDSALRCATLSCAYLAKYQLTRQRVWEGRAAAACDRATRLNADVPEVLVALGDLHFNAGHFAEATTDYRKALGFKPELFEAMLGLARSLAASGQTAEAEETCRRAIEMRPEDWRGYSWLGVVYFDSGRYTLAIEPWRNVVNLTPDNAKGHRNLGSAFFHLDRFEDAMTAYQESLSIQPNARAYSNLGTVLYFLGRNEEAVSALEKATVLVPMDPKWWGNLGNAARLIPGREEKAALALDRAISLMRERLERNPGEGESWAWLAGWHAGRGNEAEALEALRRALEIAPQNVHAMVTAGQVYLQFGRRSEGLRWLRKAVQSGYGVGALRRSPELRPFMEDPEFQSILESGPAQAGMLPEVNNQPRRSA